MKINIKKTSEIIDDKFTLSQRGILITILLVREDDPKITLAKFKAKVKMSEAKEDLIKLHKANVIEWSGYKKAVQSLEESEDMMKAKSIIDFMNGLCDRKDNYKTSSVSTPLLARLKDYDEDAIKRVISNRYAVWKDDSFMKKYLVPQTIFRASKFEKYLSEVNITKEGESFLEATKIGLNEGDVITLEIAKTFLDKENYSISIFRLDYTGKRIGNGSASIKSGADIFRTLQIQENNLKYSPREFEYVYKQK